MSKEEILRNSISSTELRIDNKPIPIIGKENWVS